MHYSRRPSRSGGSCRSRRYSETSFKVLTHSASSFLFWPGSPSTIPSYHSLTIGSLRFSKYFQMAHMLPCTQTRVSTTSNQRLNLGSQSNLSLMIFACVRSPHCHFGICSEENAIPAKHLLHARSRWRVKPKNDRSQESREHIADLLLRRLCHEKKDAEPNATSAQALTPAIVNRHLLSGNAQQRRNH